MIPMKTKLILLIVLFATGCTFQVEVLNTPMPQGPDSILVPYESPTPGIEPSATAPALPTFTPTPVADGSSASVTSSPSIEPIVFDANGTSQDVFADLQAGESKTYSLQAFQGQIMSVSIFPNEPEHQGSYALEIKGTDGILLCPFQDYACLFWRGALPSTQEYLIKVTAQFSDRFLMKVAIDPPGTASQQFTYADPLGHYTLSYSDEFAPAHFNGGQLYKFAPQLVLQDIDTQQYIPTNLGEAYFMVGTSDDPQQITTCTKPSSLMGPETNVGDVNINGIPYTRSEVQDAAAGNIYETVYHRTLQDGVCYEIIYYLRYGNIGNYTPGDVKEFDRAALLQKFEEILTTITLK